MEIDKIIKKEIERKFLVKVKLSDKQLENFPKKQVYQCYINGQTDALEVRARCTDEKEFMLNIKDVGNKIRNEITIPIDQDTFDVIWQISTPKQISKKRYYIPSPKNNNLILEYDVFEDNLEGLVLVEFENDDEKIVDNFIPEDWIGEEVTSFDEYKNRTLAIKGIPTPQEELPYDKLRKELEKTKKI